MAPLLTVRRGIHLASPPGHPPGPRFCDGRELGPCPSVGTRWVRSTCSLTAWPEPHTEMTAHSVGDLFQNVAGPAAPEASPGGRSQQSSLVPEPMFSLWLRNRKLPPGCVTLPGTGTPTLSSLPPRTDPLSSPPRPPSLFSSLRLFSPKCKCHSSFPQWVC